MLVLQKVSAANHPGYDRVTFEFTPVGTLPTGASASYTVSAADPPFSEEASGKALTVAGSKFLRVSMHDAYGADPLNLPPRATYSGTLDLAVHLPALVEVRRSGDFEGYLTWVLGLARSACWRVSTLAAPPRLVVDVATG